MIFSFALPVFADDLTGNTNVTIDIWFQNFDNASSISGTVALYYSGYKNGEEPFKISPISYNSSLNATQYTFENLPGNLSDYSAELIEINGEDTQTLLGDNPSWKFSTMVSQYTEEDGYKKAKVINYYGNYKIVFQVSAGSTAVYPLYMHKTFMNQYGNEWRARTSIPYGTYKYAVYKVSSFNNGVCSCDTDTPRATKEITINSSNDTTGEFTLAFYVPTDGGTYHVHEIDDEGNVIHGGKYFSSNPSQITFGEVAKVNGKNSYVVYRTDNGGGHYETTTAEVINYILGGNLIITNRYEGEKTTDELKFDYTIKFSDTSINGTFGDVEVVNGEGKFTLKDGEEISITGLPDGVEYEIIDDTTGYTVTKSGETDNIISETTKRAEFIYKKYSNPLTSNNLIYTSIILLISGSILFYLLKRKAINF